MGWSGINLAVTDVLAEYYRCVNGFHRAGLGRRKREDALLRPANKQIRLARIPELVQAGVLLS